MEVHSGTITESQTFDLLSPKQQASGQALPSPAQNLTRMSATWHVVHNSFAKPIGEMYDGPSKSSP